MEHGARGQRGLVAAAGALLEAPTLDRVAAAVVAAASEALGPTRPPQVGPADCLVREDGRILPATSGLIGPRRPPCPSYPLELSSTARSSTDPFVIARSNNAPSLRVRLGNPLKWSAANKCILGSLVMLSFNVWYCFGVYYALSYPGAAPYLNQPFLAVTFRVQLGLLAWWLGLAGAALWLRRSSPESPLLVRVALHAGSVNIAVGAYITGVYTSFLTGVAAVGAAAVVLILFDRRAVIPAIASLLLLVIGTTAAEQLGVIPYAPLLTTAPFEAGHLSGWWLASFGMSTLVVFLAVIALLSYMVERWRDHEVQLAETSDQLGKANELISRYVATQVARHILSGDYETIRKRLRRKLTLFFSDIQSFTDTTETTEPEELSRVLNEYLSEMVDIADRYNATVDKLVGDAIMLFFGAPTATDDEDHALRAVRMAMEMQDHLRSLRQRWSLGGFGRPFCVRIGINSGVATVGDFGSQGRVNYTAIGREVNLTARLQVSCEPGKILLSEATWLLVREHIPCIAKGEIHLRGIARPVQAYEVITRAET